MLPIFILQASVTGCVRILEGFLEILASFMLKKNNISPVCDNAVPNSLLKLRFHQAVQISAGQEHFRMVHQHKAEGRY